MKVVLPAVTGMNYEELEIADGMTANLEYMRILMNQACAH